MSYNGSGTFVINSTGQPVVTGTVISSSTFNSLTADLGTGLSTAITKDGQTTTTAKIPFAQGISAAVASNFAAGTVAAPSIYLSTDTGTGFYRIGANNNGFAISGTKLLDFSSALLAVTGAATVSTTLGVTGATTLSSTLAVTGAGTFSSTLGVNADATIGNATSANHTLNINAKATNGQGNLIWQENGTSKWTAYYLASDAKWHVYSNVAASDIMTLDASGNLLVGTTSKIAGVTGVSGGTLQVYNQGSSTVIFQNTSQPSDVVSVWNSATSGNNILVAFYTESTITGRGSITYNRGAGLVAYNVTSDYRAKDIYGPVQDSGTLIDSVPVYIGKMKGATQERPMFIAHETPAYAHTGEKDAVDKDGNPVYQQMDTSALVPVMWAEIQSLRSRVATLEPR